MTATKLKKVLEDAKNIAALAESERELGHEKAADNIAASLQRLLMRHKLTMADVENHGDDEPQEEIGRHFMNWSDFDLPQTRKRSAWIEALTHIVVNANGCGFLVTTGSNCVTIVGKPSNVAIVQQTLAVLVRSALKLSSKEYDRFYYECERADETWRAKGFKASFLKGFCTRIRERFEEAARQARASESDSHALVIIKNDKAEVAAWTAAQKFGRADRVGQTRSHNSSGYKRGQEVANDLDLNGKAVTNNSKKRKAIE